MVSNPCNKHIWEYHPQWHSECYFFRRGETTNPVMFHWVDFPSSSMVSWDTPWIFEDVFFGPTSGNSKGRGREGESKTRCQKQGEGQGQGQSQKAKAKAKSSSRRSAVGFDLLSNDLNDPMMGECGWCAKLQFMGEKLKHRRACHGRMGFIMVYPCSKKRNVTWRPGHHPGHQVKPENLLAYPLICMGKNMGSP